MKIVKITSLGCPSCIIMNKVINKITDKFPNISVTDLDYDFDDVSEYNPGKILPVFIFYNEEGKEINRLCGEHKENEFESIIEGDK